MNAIIGIIRLFLWHFETISGVPSGILMIYCLKLMYEDPRRWVCFYLVHEQDLFDKHLVHLESEVMDGHMQIYLN